MTYKNIFKGEKAIFDYLTPGAMGPTAIVELPSRLNPYLKDGVRIYIKMAQSVPLANIKSLPSWYMLDAIPKKELGKIKNLVEYSSGNTVMSLAVLSRHFGIPKMHAVITPDVPKNKQNLLRLLGARLIISDGPPSPDVHGKVGGIWDAGEMGKKPGWKNLNQYINPQNPKASGEIIGREVWKQMGSKVDILSVSLGTGGTVVGVGSYLKKRIPNLYVLATSIKRGSAIPGPRGEDAVKKLGLPWEKIADLELPIASRPAFLMSLRLVREGIFVGPSTGMQLAGVLQTVRRMKKEKGFPARKKKKPINALIIACDTMFPYIEDYFSVLPDQLKDK